MARFRFHEENWMKRTVGLPILLFFAAVGAWAVDPTARLSELPGFSPGISQRVGPQCTGGTILDDGSMENGLRSPFVSDVRFVQRFTPAAYPTVLSQVCVCWKSGLLPAAMPFALAVYDDNGAGGQPGTLLGARAPLDFPPIIL
jgi:hypothetical protein